MRGRIGIIGSANVDLTFVTPHLPTTGETVCGTHFSQSFGGKGANQAIAAARLGGLVTFIGCVGVDRHGEAIRAHLQHENIDVTYLQSTAETTGTAAIMVDAHGANCIVVVPGANHALSSAHIQQAEQHLVGCAVVMAQCETPLAATSMAFAKAKRGNGVTILNPAPACALPAELCALTDILIPNESELRALSDTDATSIHEIGFAARRLIARGVPTVIVTLGERGVLWVDAQRADHIPTANVRAVDTSGAGDAFCGALAQALAIGEGMAQAIPFAQRVATLSVTRRGTQASFPKRAELDD